MSSPRVSVIIASYNRSSDLRLSLEALFATGYPNLEVIVVDNASTDDAALVAASFKGVELIQNAENLGFAQANDIGLERATGDYIALVNNDAVIERDWIKKTVTFLEAHPRAAAVGGKLYFWDDENPAGKRENRFYAWTQVDPDSGYTAAMVDAPDAIREVSTLSGAVVMIRRAAIEDVGAPFLEPAFFAYYEETDFFARALRRGWQLFYWADAAAWHRVRASTAKEPYRYFYLMAKNRLLYAFRNFDDASLKKVLAGAAKEAASDIAKWPLDALRRGGSDEASRARRDAYRWLVSNRGLLNEQRRRMMKGDLPSYNETVRAIRARSEYYGHERPEVVALVPEGVRYVVDVGCGAGGIGRALKRDRAGVEVRGIEIVEAQAERAKTVLDDVHLGSAEADIPERWPRPDCVIFADVLEHLVDPWAVLKRWREALAPGGSIVVSIPNVGHREVLGGVLRGRWDYQDAGILDRTHLRFFTRATAIELLESAGFRVVRLERVLDLPGRTLEKVSSKVGARHQRKLRLRKDRRTPAGFIADLHTIQFLIVAV